MEQQMTGSISPPPGRRRICWRAARLGRKMLQLPRSSASFVTTRIATPAPRGARTLRRRRPVTAGAAEKMYTSSSARRPSSPDALTEQARSA